MGEVSVDCYIPEESRESNINDEKPLYSDLILQQLVENEAKLVILEYFSSSFPETEPIIYDESVEFEGLNEELDTVDQKLNDTAEKKGSKEVNNNPSLKTKSTVKLTNFAELSKSDSVLNISRSKDSKKNLIQRSDSYMSYDDFVERRERIRQWHIRKSDKKFKQVKRCVEEKRDYEKEETFVPVKEVMQNYQFSKNRACKRSLKSDLTSCNVIMSDPDKIEDGFDSYVSNRTKQRVPSEKFKIAKGKMENFFGQRKEGTPKLVLDSLTSNIKENQEVLSDEDNIESCSACSTPVGDKDLSQEENSHLSYEKFQVRREKVRQMMIPVKKYIDSDLKAEIKNFDSKTLNNIRRRQHRDENSESYQKFLEAREKIRMLHSRASKLNADPSKERRTRDDSKFSPQKKKGKKLGEKEKLYLSAVAQGSIQVDNIVTGEEKLHNEFDESATSDDSVRIEENKPVPERPRLIIPPFCPEKPDSTFTPETYAVNCLEAIAQDIMENHAELWYSAVHSLMSDEDLMKYDNFSSFASSLVTSTDGATQSILGRIGMILSVVKEAMIFGDLTDSEVEQMVDNSTKFVVESTLTDQLPLDDQSPESEIANNLNSIKAPTSPQTIKDRISYFKSMLHDWMPFMLAVITVGLALTYTSRKVEKT